jgi:hypothetical protein
MAWTAAMAFFLSASGVAMALGEASGVDGRAQRGPDMKIRRHHHGSISSDVVGESAQ